MASLLDAIRPAQSEDYSLGEKQELSAALKNPVLKGVLEKFCAAQMWRYREDCYNASENDLRRADKLRGKAEAYQDFVNELHSLLKRMQ